MWTHCGPHGAFVFTALRLIVLTLILLSVGVSPAAAQESSDDSPARDGVPRPLMSILYGGYAALQAYDGYSTALALSRGAREGNPLMQGVVRDPTAFWALKASVTAGTIVAAERLWKNDRKGAALAVMIVSTSVVAVVAANNARMLRQQR